MGNLPTAAALAVGELQRWLAHAESVSCGHGLVIDLPENVWRCDFRIDDEESGHPVSVLWTDTDTATTTVEPDMVAVRRLDGDRAPVRAGDALTITGEPVLVEER